MKLDEMRALSAYDLASMADCGGPDESESMGARLLTSVRDSVVEAIEAGRTLDDVQHEIADGAPSVYTHRRWTEFLDLNAYNEEPESGEWPTHLNDAAAVALYQIADRLVSALWADLEDDGDDDDA